MPSGLLGETIPLRNASIEIGRIGAMTWLDGDRLAIVDESSQQIHLYHRSGRLMEVFGRDGDGPGEFRRITALGTVGRRLQAFESAPGPSRAHERLDDKIWTRRDLRDDSGRYRVLGVLADGALLVTRDGFVPVVPPRAGEVRRDTMRVGLLATDGTVRWLLARPGRSWVGYESGVEPGRALMTALPLGPFAVAGASGEEAWLCDSGAATCDVFRGDATLARTVPLAPASAPAVAVVAESLRAGALASATSEFIRERARAQFEARTLPPALPAVESVLPDPRGGVWVVRRSATPGVDEMFYHGAALGRSSYVVLPRGFAARAIGSLGIGGVLSHADGSETPAFIPLTEVRR